MDVTVTLTRYREPDALLLHTLAALSSQRVVSGLRCLVLDQQESDAIRLFCKEHSTANVRLEYDVIPARSLSFARNEAVRRCDTPCLLFLDTDAAPRPGWALELSQALTAPGVGVAGGRILPRWSRTPLLLARSAIVMEQYSMLDLGGDTMSTDRVIGANFGIRKDRLGDDARFEENLGRRNGVLLGGEETELCQRAAGRALGVVYVGSAVVDHYVPRERISLNWLFRRFYFGGLSRGMQGGPPRPITRKRTPYDWLALGTLALPYAVGLARGRRRRRRK